MISIDAMNDIAIRQNEPRMLDLLKARRATYDRATKVQVAQLLVVIALPLVLAVMGLLCDESRAWVAVVSFLAVVLDGLVLDRRQRVLCQRRSDSRPAGRSKSRPLLMRA
jgi:hypothetical protein